MNKEGYLDQPSRQDLLHWAGRAISVLAISASSVFIPHSTQLGGAVENKPVPVNSLNPVDNESPIQYDQFDNNVNPTCAVVADANLIERDLPNTVITDQEMMTYSLLRVAHGDLMVVQFLQIPSIHGSLLA